jgi:hypothetical protein
MRLLCRWGVHRWARRLATHNPSRLVKRCRHCAKVRIVHVKGKTGGSRSNVIFAEFGGAPDRAAGGARPDRGQVIYDRRILRGHHGRPPGETDRAARF